MTNEAAREKVERYHIQFGTETFAVEVAFTARKRLKISVHPDRTVTVEAPDGRDIGEVLKRVRKRADWIVKQRDYFERFRPLPTPRMYISGETHVYLGRQYRLKIIPDSKDAVKLIRGYFQVFVRNDGGAERVKRLLTTWYDAHGRSIIEARIASCHDALNGMGVPYPSGVVFRRMARRWGSCSTSGKIVLNTELAKAPLHCIDYVITHELCHIKFASHGRQFYNLLTQVMPDWARRKERLERVVI